MLSGTPRLCALATVVPPFPVPSERPRLHRTHWKTQWAAARGASAAWQSPAALRRRRRRRMRRRTPPRLTRTPRATTRTTTGTSVRPAASRAAAAASGKGGKRQCTESIVRFCQPHARPPPGYERDVAVQRAFEWCARGRRRRRAACLLASKADTRLRRYAAFPALRGFLRPYVPRHADVLHVGCGNRCACATRRGRAHCSAAQRTPLFDTLHMCARCFGLAPHGCGRPTTPPPAWRACAARALLALRACSSHRDDAGRAVVA